MPAGGAATGRKAKEPLGRLEISDVSFMRGVVESTIRNMSPEERQSALRGVTHQVVALMSEEERVATLVEIVRQLAASVPEERLADALERIANPS